MKRSLVVLLVAFAGSSLLSIPCFAQGRNQAYCGNAFSGNFTPGTSCATPPEGATGMYDSSRTGQLQVPPPYAAFGPNNTFRTGQLIGKPAMSFAGEPLGWIQDVMVAGNGTAAYILLSGEQLGKPGQIIPVPWLAAAPRITADNVILGLRQEIVQDAPEFSYGEWFEFGLVQPEVNAYYFGGFEPGAYTGTCTPPASYPSNIYGQGYGGGRDSAFPQGGMSSGEY